jgi:hypothetical protein
MIPPEAFGRHCLVIGLDQRHGTFQLGLVRVDLDVLSASENRDRKRTFAPIFDARTGLDRADSVAWIIRRGRMKTPASLCHGKTTNLPVATALLATFPA